MNTHKKTFSIKAALQTGWQLFWGRPWFYLGLLGITLLLSIIQPNVNFSTQSPVVAFIFLACSIALSAIGIVVTLGTTHILLEAVRGHKPKFNAVWSKANLFWRYVGLTILIVLGIGAVSGVLIIPGVLLRSLGAPLALSIGTMIALPSIGITILTLGIMMYVYVLVDYPQDTVRQQLERSWAITKGVRLKLLGFVFVQLGVVLLGLLALVLGILVSIPVLTLATASMYDTLKKQTHYKRAHD